MYACASADTSVLVCDRVAKGLLRMGPTYGITAVSPNGAQLQKISDMAADGKVKVILDRTYPLVDAPCAPPPCEWRGYLNSALF